MSRKVFTCFIVIFFFLNKAASYGQEFQVSRDTVKVSVQEGNTSPHNERSITQSLWIYGKRLIFLPAVARPR